MSTSAPVFATIRAISGAADIHSLKIAVENNQDVANWGKSPTLGIVMTSMGSRYFSIF